MNSVLKMIFLYSDIYPIPVIIYNTSVGDWSHTMSPSLPILFPWYGKNSNKVKSFTLTVPKSQKKIKNLSKYFR